MSNGEYWTFTGVRYVLTNECYRGLWSYGKGQNIWQSQEDYPKRVLRDKPLRQAVFESLRLVSDETWYQAQKLLAELPQGNAGRKPKDGKSEKRPRLLNGLFFCREHDRRLKVGGSHGTLMYCPECRNLPKEKRSLYTYFNRALALRLTCQTIADEIRKDQELVDDIVGVCQKAVADLQSSGSDDGLREARSRLANIERQIEFVFANPGESVTDRAESSLRLKALRGERAKLLADIARYVSLRDRATQVPGEEAVRRMVDDLERILLDVASGKEPESVGALRTLLELLTGGRIELVQMGERKAQRGWLRGHLSVGLRSTLIRQIGDGIQLPAEPVKEVLLDYRETKIAEDHIEKVHERYERGMLVTAIAIELGIERHQVSEAVRIWNDRHGLPAPVDGRRRRAHVPQKLLKTPDFIADSNSAKVLYDEGLLMEEIAEQMGKHRDTVFASIKYWFTSRGLEMPDGRARRKTLPRKRRPRDSA